VTEPELRADLALVRAALNNGILIRGEISYSVAAVCEWAELKLKERPVPTGCNTTLTTTAQAPTIDELLKVAAEMRALNKRADDQLVESLRGVVGPGLVGVVLWAPRLGVPFTELLDVVEGREPPSGRFWDKVRAYFEPLREAKS
jgi:hypothetical protein